MSNTASPACKQFGYNGQTRGISSQLECDHAAFLLHDIGSIINYIEFGYNKHLVTDMHSSEDAYRPLQWPSLAGGMPRGGGCLPCGQNGGQV